MKALLAVVGTFMLAAAPSPASEWNVHTNVMQTRRLLSDSDAVYAITSGGLYRQDDSGGGYRIYNSGDGLGTHDLIAVDRRGDVFWLGGNSTVLTRFDIATGDTRRYPLALGIGRIESLLSVGDTLFVGADIGVGLFLKSQGGGLLREMYTRLGSLPAEASATDLALFAGRLWVLTPFGVVSGDPHDPALHIPGSWTDHADPTGALSSARRFQVFGDSLFVATDSGLYVLEGDLFAPRMTDRSVRSLASDGDTLWVGTDSGVYYYTVDTIAHLESFNRQDTPIEAVTRVPGGDLWVSFGRVSLHHFGSLDLWFVEAAINQPFGETFSGVAVQDGRVFCAQGQYGASYLDRDGAWRRILDIYDSPSAPTQSARSSGAQVYFPAFGLGLYRVSMTGVDPDVTQLYALNSALAPVAGDTVATVVADVAADGGGGFWAANRYTFNAQSLVYFPPADTPQVVYGASDGLGNSDLLTLLLTGRLLWIGYNGGGLGVLDFAGTPADKTDDALHLFTSARPDNLPSDVITTLLQDRNGRIWVGTPGGLARIDPEFFPFITVEFADVRPADLGILALAEDGEGSIWVGTGKGLARIPSEMLTADSVWFEGSSPLPDQRVEGLAVDRASSRLWIGTANGLATRPLNFPVASRTADVYPNPLRIRYSGDLARFDVPPGSRVDIFTLAGDRVRTLTQTYEWDGLNEDGAPAASGLYLFRVTYEDGSVGQGRLGLIRER